MNLSLKVFKLTLTRSSRLCRNAPVLPLPRACNQRPANLRKCWTKTQYRVLLKHLIAQQSPPTVVTTTTKSDKGLRDATLESAPLHPTLKVKSSHDYNLLKEQFLICSELRSGWSRLYQIDQVDASTGKTKTLSFFEDIDDIQETDVRNFKWIRSGTSMKADKRASLTLHQSLTSTMHKTLQAKMRMYTKEINLQGPLLLYYLLRNLRAGRERTIQNAEKTIMQFRTNLIAAEYNFSSVLPGLIEKIQALQDVNGPSTTVYGTLYGNILSVPNNHFCNQVMQFIAQNPKKDIPTIVLLLQHVTEVIIPNLKDIHQWDTAELTKASHGFSSELSDVTALQASLKKDQASLKKEIASYKRKKSQLIANANSPVNPPLLSTFLPVQNAVFKRIWDALAPFGNL